MKLDNDKDIVSVVQYRTISKEEQNAAFKLALPKSKLKICKIQRGRRRS